MAIFSPTVLEHAANLIGKTPSEVAQNMELLVKSHVKAYKMYQHIITVGMDIYNVEAEALGCTVRFYNDSSIPGIINRPKVVPNMNFSKEKGRIKLLLNAAAKIKAETDGIVNVGICGPFSILVELLGFEVAIERFFDEDDKLHILLENLLEFQKDYCKEISDLGLGATVFESWASPPLISPHIYRTYALPYEKLLFLHMKELGFTASPLVIGGDTRSIVDDILESGTTVLVSDYNTPLDLYVKKARNRNITVRANIDPKQILNGDWEQITKRLNEIKAVEYSKIIVGSGVVPYDTPPENLLKVRDMNT